MGPASWYRAATHRVTDGAELACDNII
jgi:hypothetical protein